MEEIVETEISCGFLVWEWRGLVRSYTAMFSIRRRRANEGLLKSANTYAKQESSEWSQNIYISKVGGLMLVQITLFYLCLMELYKGRTVFVMLRKIRLVEKEFILDSVDL